MPATRDAERKLSAQAESRRDEILESALEVISRNGFHQASITAIAERARVSRATVYQHFRDKREILVALADRIVRHVIATINAWAPLPSFNPIDTDEECRTTKHLLRELIETRVTQVLAAISANADATRLVVRLTRGNDRLVDDMLRQIDEHVVEVLSRDIEAAVGFGWARSCDAATIVRFLLGGMEKLVMHALERDEPLPLDTERMKGEIAALVYFGLANRELFVPPARSE
jgi:AcrR family transcriptional regulator